MYLSRWNSLYNIPFILFNISDSISRINFSIVAGLAVNRSYPNISVLCLLKRRSVTVKQMRYPNRASILIITVTVTYSKNSVVKKEVVAMKSHIRCNQAHCAQVKCRDFLQIRHTFRKNNMRSREFGKNNNLQKHMITHAVNCNLTYIQWCNVIRYTSVSAFSKQKIQREHERHS